MEQFIAKLLSISVSHFSSSDMWQKKPILMNVISYIYKLKKTLLFKSSFFISVEEPYAESHPRPHRWFSTERTCSEFQIHKIYLSSPPLENVNWEIDVLTLWIAGFPHISRESFCARVTQQQANVWSVT